MAEFVERCLEELLPAFEQLQLVELFNPTELDTFIKQCRNFEYKCSKKTKRAKDFLEYAHYMAEQLKFLETRRKEMKYMHRYDEIDRVLKQKCAHLYRICSQRFRKLEYYLEEIDFLARVNMLKPCSQAYTRLLQIHGFIADNYVKAARFEFFNNSYSAETARSILMTGLRRFPQKIELWATHFEIELRYVEYLLNRQLFFLNKTEKQKSGGNSGALGEESRTPNSPDDGLLELKLVRIVYELAMKSIEDPTEKTKLLRLFLNCVEQCGEFAKELQQNIREHLEALGADPDLDGHIDQMTNDELFTVDTIAVEMTEIVPDLIVKEKDIAKPKKSSVLDGFNPDDPEIKELLSKAVLTEDYDKKPLEEVLAKSINQQKKQRKVQREKTAGKDWFAMPATEMTDERRHDLELVQMRDALDPKQKYKKPDRDVLPKYFQVGRIVESKADFYSARVPRKQRKRTMVEELMHDHELLARSKRRYTDIIRKKERTSRGVFQSRGVLPKRSRRKNKQRH